MIQDGLNAWAKAQISKALWTGFAVVIAVFIAGLLAGYLI